MQQADFLRSTTTKLEQIIPTSKIDFHNAECSACRKKHVDIRTEIIAPSPDRPNAIRKRIIFRCEDHLDSDIDEIEKLALVKKRYQDLDENDLVDGETFFNQLDSEEI